MKKMILWLSGGIGFVVAILLITFVFLYSIYFLSTRYYEEPIQNKPQQEIRIDGKKLENNIPYVETYEVTDKQTGKKYLLFTDGHGMQMKEE